MMAKLRGVVGGVEVIGQVRDECTACIGRGRVHVVRWSACVCMCVCVCTCVCVCVPAHVHECKPLREEVTVRREG